MNNFSKLSLYDFLAMLIPGFVILWFFNFFGIERTIAINDILIAILSYITGLCYHKLIEWFVTITPIRRNNCMQERAWKQFYKGIGIEKACPKNIDEEFVLSYYRIARAGSLMNIPILEAQETFLRNMIPLIFIEIIRMGCGIHSDKICCSCSCCLCVFLGVILLLSIFAWLSITKKIYFLAWEGNHYLKELNDEKTAH